jgi:hypothetical protein
MALKLAFGIGLATALAGVAQAQTFERAAGATPAASPPSITDLSAQRRTSQRPPTRLRVHPRYTPGPNAVRDCTATYVQEFRPSGTVIVPHLNCFWRRG